MAMTDNDVPGGSALLVDATATGTWKTWPGGRGTFMVEGTFDGATVTLQMKGPNGTPLPVGDDVTLTDEGGGNFELCACEIRAAVSGGSSPSGLYAIAHLIPQPAA